MKKISVVTINLNRCTDLESTIRSLAAQNLASDVEYIVVDGMSSDGSHRVIEKYREYIDAVVVEKDDGIFDAMNKGLDLVSGYYVYFLNSGDVFADSNVLKDVISAIEASENKFNIICGKVNLYNEGKYLMTADLYPWIPHQSAFVKTEKLRSYRFDKLFKVYGDLDLWTRMRKRGDYSVLYIDKLIANFELNGIGNDPNSLDQQYKDKKKYLKKHNYYFKLLLANAQFILDISLYNFLGRDTYFKYKKLTSIPIKLVKKVLNF